MNLLLLILDLDIHIGYLLKTVLSVRMLMANLAFCDSSEYRQLKGAVGSSHGEGSRLLFDGYTTVLWPTTAVGSNQGEGSSALFVGLIVESTDLLKAVADMSDLFGCKPPSKQPTKTAIFCS